MQIKKFTPDYLTLIKHTLLFFILVAFNKLEQNVFPYSSAIFVNAIFTDFNPIITSILFCFSFLVFGETGYLAFSIITSCFLIIINFIYKKIQIKVKYEIIIFTLLIMVFYCIIGNSINDVSLNKKIQVAIFTFILTIITFIFSNTTYKSGLKFKPSFEQFICSICLYILLGLGASNTVSPYMWKAFSILCILLVSFVYKKGTCTIFSALSGISFAIYYGNISYVSIYLLMGLFAENVVEFSRYLSAISIIVIDYFAQELFQIYGSYTTVDFLFCFIGVAMFCIIPNTLLKKLKDKISVFRERQLTRVSINRNRTFLSNNLFELSSVFNEMSQAFSLFKKNSLSDQTAKTFIVKDILANVCKNCDNAINCKRVESQIIGDIDSMAQIGLAKGKLSLIDLPNNLSKTCIHPNNILFGLNKLLAELRNQAIENANVSTGRQLIADQAKGVSEVLRHLALASGTLLKFHSSLERKLCDSLQKNGFCVSEILVYGEDKNLEIGLILSMKEIELDKIIYTINKTLGTDMTLTEKCDLSQDKCYLYFKFTAPFDAIFGIAQATKDGSSRSGDTHAVTRLKDDKFLVALSDGMGSGQSANDISSTSLSLIESFYRAGLNNQLILNTVAKLMAINAEESFSALDICVVDLKTASADFIKYGAPYGFILSENGIRIIESTSLPLGILEEIKPSVATTNLSDGDIVLCVTDGISEAFGSSSDIIEHLRTLPALNPQTLANDILNKAITLNGGKKNDDMTVLAIRILKRNNNLNVKSA